MKTSLQVVQEKLASIKRHNEHTRYNLDTEHMHNVTHLLNIIEAQAKALFEVKQMCEHHLNSKYHETVTFALLSTLNDL